MSALMPKCATPSGLLTFIPLHTPLTTHSCTVGYCAQVCASLESRKYHDLLWFIDFFTGKIRGVCNFSIGLPHGEKKVLCDRSLTSIKILVQPIKLELELSIRLITPASPGLHWLPWLLYSPKDNPTAHIPSHRSF